MPIDIGQRTMKVFTLAPSGEPPGVFGFCDDGRFDCDFMLHVYANGSTNKFQNDKSSLLVLATNFITTIEFAIEKKIGTIYVEQAIITDNSYGEYYAQGDFASKPDYSGIIIYWSLILTAFGVGEYRIKTTQTNSLGDQISYSKPYCLKEYVCAPENTVRLEWWLNNGIGNIDNDREVLDFADLNWYNQIRIPKSIFGYPTSTYEIEQVHYSNGEFEDITNVQTEKYQLISGPMPAWVHNLIKTYAMQGDDLQITDYSPNNPQEIREKRVKIVSAYEPRWTRGSKCAPVTIELEPSFNNLEKDRCL